MSFLPSISAGNLRKRLPASFKFDNDLTWTRPSQWLDLGTSTYDGTTPEKIIGLVAVFPNDVAPANNYVAFNLATTGSTYTVNWGDGTTETLAENVDQHHVYDYDSITSDTSTTKATPYRGYKQVKFEVTPTDSSTKFSIISFDVNGPFVTHTHYAIRMGPNILDLFVSTSNATSLNINNNKNMRLVEQLEIRNTSSNRLDNPQRLYSGCRSLQSIPFVPWIRNNTSRDYLYAFQQCNRLKFLPDEFASQDKFWFKNMSRLQSCFQQCQQLEYLPEGLFGDSEQTNLGSCYNAFYLCYKLRYIPYLGIPTGTGQNVQLRNIFHSTISLTNIPKGFTFQTVEGNGLNGVFHECRSIKDFSAIFDGTTDAFANINRTTVQMQSLFRGFSQLTEFPYVGNFNKCDNATQLFYNCKNVIRFNSLYTHLDFTNAKDMNGTFQNMECLEELPEIKVRSLTDQSSTSQTFAQMRRLTSIKVTGMIAGASDGEYYRMFINCHCLNCIDGIDFSFATEASDYNQMFNQTRNINAIKFPGTFRAGYASPRINVTVNGHADVSGEYQIATNGVDYEQLGGDGLIYRTGPDGSGGYQWSFIDNSDGAPSHSTSFEASTEKTPHLAATWPSNTLTFSEVKTGFKYTVTGGSGDGLRYSPIKRTQMLEIFNQLADVSYSATIDIRNNSYTADLTSDDIAIATNKGWTVINNEGTFT